MKLSEVIAELEIDPAKKFIGKIGQSVPIILNNFEGQIIARYEHGGKVPCISLDRLWEEVEQPVTWQEAIEAWMDGDTVYSVDSDGKKCVYTGHYNWMENDDGIGITKDELKCHKWYIGEEE